MAAVLAYNHFRRKKQPDSPSAASEQHQKEPPNIDTSPATIGSPSSPNASARTPAISSITQHSSNGRLTHRIPARWARKLSKDEALLLHREQRIMPLARDPLSRDHGKHDGPTWLDLFTDLFFVSTLSAFSGSAQVFTLSAETATAVGFYVLLYSVWFALIGYDVKFETRDWVHRFWRLCHLIAFAVLGGFSGRFNIGLVGPVPDGLEGSELEAFRLASISWNGLALAFSISRFVLALQYAYVVVWALVKRRKVPIGVPTIMTGHIIVAAVWLALRLAPAPGVSWRISVGYAVLAVEAITGFLSSRLNDRHLVASDVGLLVERMCLLTLIVIGEGVINITRAIQTTVSSLGLASSDWIQIFLAVLDLLLIWYLLFGGFEREAEMGTRRARVWALLHAPLTTLLLIYFEGLSSALGFADASPLISSLFDELLVYRTALVDGMAVPQAITDQLTNQLGLLGISLSDYTSTLRALPAAARETQLNRYFAQIVYSLFQQLGTPPTIEGADLYKRIMTEDSAATLENALDFVSNSSEGVLEPILAVFPAAGGVLLVSVILRWIQRTPADVFEYLEALPRIVFGVAFCLLGLLDIGDSSAVYVGDVTRISSLAQSGWILPIVTLFFVLLAVIEYGVWLFSYYSIRKRVMLEAIPSPEEKTPITEEPASTETDAAQQKETPEIDERVPPKETVSAIESRLDRARTERSMVRSRDQSTGPGLPRLEDPIG